MAELIIPEPNGAGKISAPGFPQKKAARPTFMVSLEFFSGPLDLLLHLVNQQEVSIEKVQMSVIAEQYLEIVMKETSRLDLERASEYLVIAATLLSIKSSSLLPAPVKEEDTGTDNFVDTRFFEDLRARIKAFELTKLRAQALIRAPQLGVDTFARIDRKALQVTPEMLAESEDVQTLVHLFSGVMKRIGGLTNGLRIVVPQISVLSFMMKVLDSFASFGETVQNSERTIKKMSFRSFLHNFVSSSAAQSTTKSFQQTELRSVVVGSFVAVLELVKRGILSVSQEDDHGQIVLNTKLEEDSTLAINQDFQSEFDRPDDTTSFDESSNARDRKVIHMANYRPLGSRDTNQVNGDESNTFETRERVNAGAC